MPRRLHQINTNQIYHVYNRAVLKTTLFPDTIDYSRFINLLFFYHQFSYPYSLLEQYLRKNHVVLRDEIFPSDFLSQFRIDPLVRILGYCLMPNHFHLIIQQLVDTGIRTYMHKIGSSYSQYFNKKYDNQGAIFQGRFKLIPVDSQEQLTNLSRYIHRNPLKLPNINENHLFEYPWSSFTQYLSNTSNPNISPEQILHVFKSKIKYKQFVLDSTENDDNISSELEIDGGH